MRKKAIIVVNLVPKSADVSNTQIKKEIQHESSIPWAKEIEKVTIIEPHK
jgi:hypothetical protein